MMKITDKTIKLITALSIFFSLAFIVVSLVLHLDNDWRSSLNETTPSESTSLSIDSTTHITFPSDTTEVISDDTTSPESNTMTQAEDVTVGATVVPETTVEITVHPNTTVEVTTTIPETTVEETTVAETTVQETTVAETTEAETTVEETTVGTTEVETTAEVTEPAIETTPETTVHVHSYSDWIVYKEASCENNGGMKRSCECGKMDYQPIFSTGHKEKKLAAVDATCTTEGKTQGTICSVCDKVLVKPTSIPKLECNYDNLVCINCGQIKNTSISLTAPYAGLYKADTLECLYATGTDIKTPPASLTKMITACVAIKNMPLNAVITVGSELSLVPKYSSLCYIYKGNKIKLYDLLTGMLLCSGNDAAYSIAANVGRYASGNQSMSDQAAVDYFCTLMNDYAKEIGAQNTNFTTPDGSDSENQYSTVEDIAIITAHAMKNKTIAEIVAIHYKKVVFASGQIAKWTNTNELINPDSTYYNEEVTGFKTGGTENAGKCLSATFKDNGETYIAIVLGCEDNTARYENIIKLIELITND